MFSLFLVVFGCSVTVPNPLTVVPTVVLPDCEDIAVTDCEDTTGCAPILGRETLDVDPVCLEEGTPLTALGCQDEGLSCPAVEAVASNGDGDVFVFPSGCIPDDFTSESFTVEACPTCEEVAPGACVAAGCSLIRGRPLLVDSLLEVCSDENLSPEPLGCMTDANCDDVLTWASEVEGSEVFEFPNSCIPHGWVDVEGGFPDCECGSYRPDHCPSFCVVISGRPLSSDAIGDCVDYGDPMEPLACADQNGCGDLETYAIDPITDETWYFSDTCTVPGWTLDHEQNYPTCLIP